MKRFFWAFFIVVLFLSCKTTPNTQDTLTTLFRFPSGEIGTVVDNTVKFYYHDDNKSLNELPKMELTLPDGYKSVFNFSTDEIAGIGVIVGNTAKFYYYDDDNGWLEEPKMEFTLPGGSKSVFQFYDYNVAGVEVGNAIKFYNFSHDRWYEEPHMEFTLPSGYKSVFNYSNDEFFRVGVVVGNTAKFFSLEVKPKEDFIGWVEKQEMELTLPNKYDNVFSTLYNNFYIIMVIGDNTATAYHFNDSDGWISEKR